MGNIWRGKCVFRVSVNIGKENFGEWLTIHQIRQFLPYQNFSMYGILYRRIWCKIFGIVMPCRDTVFYRLIAAPQIVAVLR